MKKQKNVIRLHNTNNEIILIGTESIIEAIPCTIKELNIVGTKIVSRGAMVCTNWVIESVDEIYNLINS
jgi:hypothetical protein